MKTFRKILLSLLLLLAVFVLLAFATGNSYLVKSVAWNFADVDDYKKFDNHEVSAGAAQPWPVSASYNKQSLPDSLAASLRDLETGALLVIRNDSIVFEEYWDEFSADGLSGSFSVAKSITSILVGVALKEGKIRSLDQPVSDFLPAFRGEGREAVTLRHLLTMSSGTDFSESYQNPFSITAELYYGDDLAKTATGVKVIHQPGTLHKYKSGDTQLLGLVLEKATGQSLASYAAEKLWKPLGADRPALWSTDQPNGNTKAYCCFNSNARDFARIGQLMLQKGQWKGQTIIDSSYWAASTAPCGVADEAGAPCDYYGYQWWISPDHPGVFYARGILGQYIMVFPEQQAVVVRLGKVKSPVLQQHTPKIVYDMANWIPTL